MSVAKGFVTQTAFKKHLDGDWRTVHELWSHIRNYMTSYPAPAATTYTKTEIDAMFEGYSGGKAQVDAGNVVGLTQGSIPFADASGFLTEDNSNLFWDASNLRLGIDQAAPTARIDIVAAGTEPGINISAGANGEMSTPDGEQFRWGHWNSGTTTFTERLRFDAAGVFYISYLTTGYVIFAGANGEIKQDADFYWDNANKRLGIGKSPSNVLDVEGVGSTIGGTSYGGVVAVFHCTENKHVTLAIDAITGKDPVLAFSENAICIWDIRNDASETDEFQIRYQVGEVNRTDFKIDNAGNVTIPTGTLSCGYLMVTDPDEAIAIVGGAIGDANKTWIAFYDSNMTRRGYVGDASINNDDIYLASDTGDIRLESGGGNVLISGTVTIANGGSINLQEDITFTGATAQNLIKFPDNLPDALSFMEGANPYQTFITTNGSEAIQFHKPVGIGTASPVGLLDLSNATPNLLLRNPALTFVTYYGVTDVVGSFTKKHGSQGGLRIFGQTYTGATQRIPLTLVGAAGVDAAITQPAVVIEGYKNDGADGLTALTGTEDVLQVRAGTTPLLTVEAAGVVTVVGCLTDGTCEIMKNEDALGIIDDILKTGSGKKDEYNHERMDMKKIHQKYPFMIHEQITEDEDGKKKTGYFDKLGAKSDLIYVAIGQLQEKIEILEAQLNN